MFFDYNFDDAKRSTYRYATTFYPLWAGLATDAQARAVVKELSVFERPGGLVTSVQETEGQWDYPFGWAPIQLLAVEGMRRYGHNVEADHVSTEFLSTVLENFKRDGTIREKYNLVTRSSDTNVKVGYAANVIGFGWTNATFVELLHELPPEKVNQLAEATRPVAASPENELAATQNPALHRADLDVAPQVWNRVEKNIPRKQQSCRTHYHRYC